MKEIRKVTLREEDHKYIDETSTNYTSVTTIIGQYKEKFDSEYWSKYKAIEMYFREKRGDRYWLLLKQNTGTKNIVPLLSKNIDADILNNYIEKVKASWKEKTDSANERGTETHNKLELGATIKRNLDLTEYDKSNYTNNNLNFNKNLHNLSLIDNDYIDILKYKYPKIFKVINDFILKGYLVFPEQVVYSVEHNIAGMIDLLLVKDNNFYILDWKTNKRPISFISGYYKKDNFTGLETKEFVKTSDKMLYPINNLDNCSGTHYTLQLSLYAWLLELWGYSCRGLYIYHLVDNNVGDLQVHKITYLKQTIEKLINHFVNNNKNTNGN